MSKADKQLRRKAKREQKRLGRLPGRDRKEGPRKPCGRLRQPTEREREQDVLAVSLNNPERRWAADPRSRYLGFAIGVLFYTKQIDGPQLQAAERYASLRKRWLYAKQAGGETAKALAIGDDSLSRPLWSQALSDEDDLQAAVDAAKQWNDCLNVLRDCGRVLHGSTNCKRVEETVRLAIAENSVRDVGDLRSGLNVLAIMWGYRKANIW